MENKKVRKSQIIAAALLTGFDDISEVDLNLFIEMFLKNNPNLEVEIDYITDIAKYISIKNDKISLWDKNSVKELKNIAGNAMDFFDSFDYEEFLIRKIGPNGSCLEYEVNTLFSKIEQEKIKELEESGYLTGTFNDDIPYNDHKDYKLSSKGIIKYFKSVYKEEIEEFEAKLKSLRYDTSLLDDYFMSINYDNLARDAELVEVTMLGMILDINAFDEYCTRHDRPKYIDDSSCICPGYVTEKLKSGEKIKILYMGHNSNWYLVEQLNSHENCKVYVCGSGSSYIKMKKHLVLDDIDFIILDSHFHYDKYEENYITNLAYNASSENKRVTVGYAYILPPEERKYDEMFREIKIFSFKNSQGIEEVTHSSSSFSALDLVNLVVATHDSYEEQYAKRKDA